MFSDFTEITGFQQEVGSKGKINTRAEIMKEWHNDAKIAGNSIVWVVQGKINFWAETDDVARSVSSGGQNHLAQ